MNLGALLAGSEATGNDSVTGIIEDGDGDGDNDNGSWSLAATSLSSIKLSPIKAIEEVISSVRLTSDVYLYKYIFKKINHMPNAQLLVKYNSIANMEMA